MILKSTQNFLLLLLTLIVLNNCESKKTITDNQKTEHSDKEDFDTFYDRFTNDSTFQMSRLKFPLGGRDEFGNEWTTKNWNLIKSKVYDVDKSKFKVDYKKTETEFFEKVWIENSGFSTESRFKLIDGKWYLVYDFESNN